MGSVAPLLSGWSAVAFQLDGPALGGRGDQRHPAPAAGHRRGVEHRLARDEPLDRLRIRHQVRLRPAAAGQAETRQGERTAHQLEERAARHVVALHLGGPGRELAFQPIAELRRVLQFADAAPVLAAGRVGLLGRMLENSFHRGLNW